MEDLEEKLLKMATSDARAVKLLMQIAIPISFTKQAIIGMPGHSFPLIYYIKKGLIRMYTADVNEHTHWVMDNGFILPLKGFFNTTANSEFLQVMDYSEGYSINIAKAELLARENPVLYRILLEIYEERLRFINEHLIILAIKDGYERYTAYLNIHKNIPAAITNQQLASMLRIDPKQLYKIKSRHSKTR